MDSGLQKKGLNILCLLINHDRVLDQPLVTVLPPVHRDSNPYIECFIHKYLKSKKYVAFGI
jgi:hypothetical protein